MTSQQIRQSFLNFFEQRGHRIVPSSPVIPHGDPTLLFTNAGMNQFKDVFLATGKRDYVRAADTQKCIRVSGKHNDLEEVGRDTYHHTFFEMLGNWSFGDYYKKEAIEWAWELLTKEWRVEKHRLYATVFETDDEAFELWKKVTDIDPSHIRKFGKKDNFWEMGDTGPCGPCSEIHIDLSEDGNCGDLVNKGDPRVMEIWNLVFIQSNRNEKDELENLPAKHVDTGMGFERVCAVLQGKKSNYDTDVFQPIIEFISDLTDKHYRGSLPTDPRSVWTDIDIAIRVIADHVRMLSFAIADGAIPSNKDQGYVLRRILNRASRFGRTLNMRQPFIHKIVDVVADSMGNAFPELREKRDYIKHVIKAEEERFNETQVNGLDYFYRNIIGEPIRQAYIQKARIGKYWWVDNFNTDGNTLIFLDPSATQDVKVNISEELKSLGIKSITGEDAFKLHDTYGVHIDSTEGLAKEVGIQVDRARYDELMEAQRDRSRGFLADTTQQDERELARYPININEPDRVKGSRFVAYDESFLETTTEVIETSISWAVLKENPFYAQSGGQVSDRGILERKNGETIPILDVQKAWEVNILRFDPAYKLEPSEIVKATVERPRRTNIQRNHSATHLVHEALRRVLGAHVHQQGSLVAPDHLRFDFPHFGKISPEEIRAIEEMVNEKIAEDIGVFTEVDMPIEKAKKIPNVKMFFGEKYGDIVRVVFIDENYSVEFCGGTHVKNTRDIGLFKIISESSIASGVRRIEARTGEGIQQYIDEQLDKAKHLDDQLAKFIEEKEMLELELQKYGDDRHLRPRSLAGDGHLGSIFLPSSQSEAIRSVEAGLIQREQTLEQLTKQTLDLKKELSKYKVEEASSGIESLVAGASSINGFKVVSSKIEAATMDELKSIGDTLRSKLGSGVGILASIIEDKVALVCVVTDDLIKTKNLQAGKIVGEMAKQVGGGGGGKPHLATAGGKDVAKLHDALGKTVEIVKSFVTT